MPRASEQVSLCTTTTEPVGCRAHKPQLTSPCAATAEAHVPRARAPKQEKPPQREACALQLEKALVQREDSARPKEMNKNNKINPSVL